MAADRATVRPCDRVTVRRLELLEDGRHLDGGHGGVPALVAHLGAGALDGLLEAVGGDEAAGADDADEGGRPLWQHVALLVVGAALIAWGADLLVKNATLIAQAIGIPESVIGLTLVALGTSLPELVTAVTSLMKGHASLSLGNIIGANLFNIVLVSGTATVLSPFAIPQEKTLAGWPTSLVVDIPVMLAVMALLTIPPMATGRMARWQGIVLLCIYIAFCVFQFMA